MMLPSTAETAHEIKSCCAALYSSDAARVLLGDSFHPGGTGMTDRLADRLGIGPETRVLDIAAGVGTSAIHLASTRGCKVVATDLSEANLAEGARRASAAGVSDLVDFRRADAEDLDVDTGSFDAIVCECAFCTFPDKAAAARSMARALRPGGRVGISDLTTRGGLPDELQGLLAWVACIADALPVDGYRDALAAGGLHVDEVEACDEALREMVESIRARITGARLLVETGRLTLPGVDLEEARGLARAAKKTVEEGTLGYVLITASKPLPSSE